MSVRSLQVRVLVAGIVISTSSLSPVAQGRLKTPFQVVSLWSNEMLAYLTGEKQTACSGPGAVECARLHTAMCDDTAYVASRTVDWPEHVRLFESARSEVPRSFGLQIAGVAATLAGVNIHYVRSPEEFAAMRLVFSCAFSGNDNPCPAGRYQAGVVSRVEMRDPGTGRTIDLTPYTAVTPDGLIVFRMDERERVSVFNSAPPLYQIRAAAECFTVASTPVEWESPLYDAPDTGARSIGTLVSRVIAGEGQQLIYRSNDGQQVAFMPDWVEEDWGYEYLMEQTILDRRDDWVLLPERPFPRAAWVRIPNVKVSTLEPGTFYSLTKTVRARRKDTRRFETLKGNIVVLVVRGRTLEVRKEQPSDMACGAEDVPPRDFNAPTYLVEAEQLYDGDLHLAVKPAYTRGC